MILDEFGDYSQSVCMYEGVGLVLTGGKCNKYKCEIYCVAANVWKKLSNLRTPRYWHVSVCIRKELFIFGGSVSDGEGASANVEYLDMTKLSKSWQPAPSIPTAVGSPKVAYINANVFLMGDKSDQLYHFDAVAKVWRSRAELPHSPGHGFSMASDNESIYVAGGINKLCYKYNPTTEAWTQLRCPLLEHNYGALVFHDSNLLLVSGMMSGDIEEYDIEDGTWSTAPYGFTRQTGECLAFSMHIPESRPWLSINQCTCM